MKIMIAIILAALLMTGCAATETFEKVQDVYKGETLKSPGEVKIQLPPDTGKTVLTGAQGRVYFCEGYEIAIETFIGGDLQRTVKNISGYDYENITIFETVASSGLKRYEFVWTSVGAEGEMVGRSVIIDDGSYHYCVSMLANSEEVGSLQSVWQEVLQTIAV